MFFAASASAASLATWKSRPLATPVPSVSTFAPVSSWTCAKYGSQIAQASTSPPLNAPSASAGCRITSCTSSGVSPTFRRLSSTCPCAELPRASAIFFPRRSSTRRSGESRGTISASLVTLPFDADTTFTLRFAAAANSGGVLPTPPMSTAPADAASSSGGPEVNVAHSIA